MVYIYILLLQKNKYYVGKTTRPTFRLKQHFDSGGSSWTKKYKPIKIIKIIPNCDDYDEDKYTKMYMDNHGIDNVRGGSYSTVRLDKTTVDNLKRMSNGTNDKCFECGKKGHFSKYCPNRKRKTKKIRKTNNHESDEELCIWNSESESEEEESEEEESEEEESEEEESEEEESEEDEQCWSCSYCNKGFTTKKGAQFHENVHCKARKNKWSGHYASNWNAKH